MSFSEAGDEIEEEEIYEVPADAVEIWRSAKRLSGEGERGRVLTAKALDVLRVLLWAFHAGRIPDYETIGYEAGCSRATTTLAIKALKSAGILAASMPLRLAEPLAAPDIAAPAHGSEP
jgi:hypothetical protein